MLDADVSVSVLIFVVANMFVLTVAAVVVTTLMNLVRMVEAGRAGVVWCIAVVMAVGKYWHEDEQHNGQYQNPNCKKPLH